MEMILILARGHDSVARRGVLYLHLTPMDAPATGGCGGTAGGCIRAFLGRGNSRFPLHLNLISRFN